MGNLADKTYAISKITPPAPKGILSRKKLDEFLDKQDGRSIVWVQGPPGSGKTSFVAAYIKTRKLNHIWYRVDETDDDPATLFNYLPLAAGKGGIELEATGLQTDPKDESARSADTRRLFRALYATLPLPFIIVFDDYQEQTGDSDFHRMLRLGMEELPEQVRIILLSRGPLPRDFRRLQGNGCIDFVGWNDLRLTASEHSDIVDLRAKGHCSKALVDRIYTKTRGWAAGLVFLLDGLAGRDQDSTDLDDLSYEPVFEYFETEILKDVDDLDRTLLYKCSLLQKMTSEMAAKMTGEADAAARVFKILGQSGFLDRLEVPQLQYCFHPLFGDFLVHCAMQTFSAVGLKQLQEKAAGILLGENEIENAAELISEMQDWPSLEELVVKNARGLLTQGKNRMLTNWIMRLPEDTLFRKSWLLYWLGVGRMPFEPQICQDYFEIAFSLFRKSKDSQGIFASWSGIIRANIFKFRSNDSFIKWIPVLDTLKAEFSDYASADDEAGVLISLLTGMLLVGSDYERIEKNGIRLAELIETSHNKYIRKKGILLLSFYYLLRGELHQSETLLLSIKAENPEQETLLVDRLLESHLNIFNLFFQARFAECLEIIGSEEGNLDRYDMHHWQILLKGHEAAVYLSDDDPDKAAEALDIIKSELVNKQDINTYYYYILYSWSLLERDTFFALHLSQNALKLAIEFDYSFLIHIASIAVAYGHCELGQEERAHESLQEAYRCAKKMRSRQAAFMCQLVDAYLSLKAGDDKPVAEKLERAFSNGRRLETLNFFFWRPAVMSSLCVKALELGIEKEYIKNLVRKRSLTIDASTRHVESWPWRVKIFTLGKFEIRVDDIPLSFSGKVQKTPLAILKILLAFGCTQVRESRISDILWPESSGDAGYRALITTIQRLRRLLGYKEAILFNEGMLSINSSYCWVDLWAVDQHVNQVQGYWKSEAPEDRIEQIVQQTQMLYEKYKAPFLPGEIDQPWTFDTRNRIQKGVLDSIVSLAEYWEGQKAWRNALEAYEKALEINSTAEELFQKMMICYHRMGCRAEAIALYHLCQETLHSNLGITPSMHTRKIYESIVDL